jgi:hypothetical protein
MLTYSSAPVGFRVREGSSLSRERVSLSQDDSYAPHGTTYDSHGPYKGSKPQDANRCGLVLFPFGKGGKLVG